MLNPSTDNVIMEFHPEFFSNETILKKYDKYLYNLNGPIKNIRDYMRESIQDVETPGISLQTIEANGLSNLRGANLSNFPPSTVNKQYPGTAPMNDVFDAKILNITFRNTIINWCYVYEIFEAYYRRTRKISDFGFSIIMLDSANNPLVGFNFSDCFVASMPGLNFSFNTTFGEVKTFTVGFAFNRLDIDLKIPKFNVTDIDLSIERNK